MDFFCVVCAEFKEVCPSGQMCAHFIHLFPPQIAQTKRNLRSAEQSQVCWKNASMFGIRISRKLDEAAEVFVEKFSFVRAPNAG